MEWLVFPFSFFLALLRLPFLIARSLILLVLRWGFGIRIPVKKVPRLIYIDHKFHPRPHDGVLLEIEGRYGNIFVDWLMRKVFGRSSRSSIRVTNKEVRVTNTGLFGRHQYVVSLSAITTSRYSYAKPFRLVMFAAGIIGAAIIGNFIFIQGLAASVNQYGYSNSSVSATEIIFNEATIISMVIALIISVLMIAVYATSREFFVGFSTQNIDTVAGVTVYPSLPFGLGGNLPYEDLKRIFEYINKNIIQAHHIQIAIPAE